jgi:hypothetical protein
MGGSSYELIMQEVLNQKQRMDDLLVENRELRRQLADLREGHGIFVEIEGIQFALTNEMFADTSHVQAVPAPQDTSAIVEPTPTPMPVTVSVPVSASDESVMGTIPETPFPTTDEFTPIAQFSDEVEDEEELPTPTQHSTFLEEMLIDEFASAATSPMAVWRGPETRKLDVIDEERKASLRKELIGSFLLE